MFKISFLSVIMVCLFSFNSYGFLDMSKMIGDVIDYCSEPLEQVKSQCDAEVTPFPDQKPERRPGKAERKKMKARIVCLCENKSKLSKSCKSAIERMPGFIKPKVCKSL